MSDSAGAETYNTKNYVNPFPQEWPLNAKFEEVITEQKDLIILIDDMGGDRGTGKTILSLVLADALDQTPVGITHDKVTMSAEELRNAYASQPKRSGLVLDEGEVSASNRAAMTRTNKALREIMSMGRVEEKYVVVNTPLRHFIDKDIQKLANIWIGMFRKGLGLVHFLDWETYSETLLKPKTQWLPFEDVPRSHTVRDVYNRLTREKRSRIQGDEGSAYVLESEVKERIEKAEKNAKREKRDDVIRSFWREFEDEEPITKSRMARALDLDPSRVSQITRE